jgi:16S rRNA A1518/A1519 N6-dimethyltransferase RsmA/KsgA/DIM1 with predicted DNA glycosylase/AP lyase activity
MIAMNVFYWAVLIIISTALLTLLLKMGTTIATMFYGTVFVTSADDKLKSMLKLAKAKKGEKIIDLGCGDGKILLELARKGFAVEGVEINPNLVRQCRKKARKEGLEKLITVTTKSFWKMDFSDYDLVFLYGTSYIMERLEKKVRQKHTIPTMKLRKRQKTY